MKRLRKSSVFLFRRRALDELSKILSKNSGGRNNTPPPRFSVIKSPAHFDVYDGGPRKYTVLFIEKIRRMVNEGCRRIWIDFSDTRKFGSGGAILFFAELSRLIENTSALMIRGSLPKNNKAAQVLQQIGLSKLLKTKNKTECLDGDVVNWRSARGQGAIGEKYDEIMGYYDGRITESLQSELYTGITEAMTNAHQHAYIDQRGDGITTPASYRPWWMFSQEKDGKLSVVFCDLGIGIPSSLPRTRPRLWHLMRNMSQGRQIEGAVRNSQTRTKKQHRGKGLRQIIQTISTCEGGKAVILSNKGWYSMKAGKRDSGDFADSIMGTVIYWQMPLPPRLEA